MDESLLAGLLMICASLPGIGIGAAILIGKFRPAQVTTARHPDRARVATGGFLVLVNLLVAGLGALVLWTPPAQLEPLARWGVTVVIGVSTLGLIPLLRAVRA